MFKLALVTGASSGIGEALCYLLAEKGIPLIVSGRNPDKLLELKEALHISVEVISADLVDPSERAKLVSVIQEQIPDLVINNAGFGLYGEATAHSTEKQLHILKVNGEAVLELSLEAARAMQDAGKEGVVMNISSVAAFQVFPTFAVYAASKAFVNLFSESFDLEMRPYGIRVLAACPGVVATNFRVRSGGSKEGATGMTATFAANEIWKQIVQRKPIRIFDWKFRFATFLTKWILPKSFVQWTLKANIKRRTQS